jgi:hypothetical protein
MISPRTSNMTRQLLVVSVAAALTGCMVGPNYKRPPLLLLRNFVRVSRSRHKRRWEM